MRKGELKMKTKLNFNHTRFACYISIINQALICGFLPLLFVIFNRKYDIPLTLITLLASTNFVVQFFMDLLSLFFIDKISYRGTIVFAHILTAAGFLSLGLIAPFAQNTYLAILISVILFSAGGGFIEVMTSPIIEGCPSDNKAAAMSLLHSMFGFGSVGVIVLTNLLLLILGADKWHIIAVLWAILPLFNIFFFMFVPINKLVKNEERTPLSTLFTKKSFMLFALIMLCGGAAEIGMSQWSSAFAEMSLGVSKTVGDILGPCIFAMMMALSRLFYAKCAERIKLIDYLIVCGVMTFVFYLISALTPIKILALLACGLCGFSVGIMWPGALSLASKMYPAGGVALFGVLALAGDVGCTSGPSLVGFVASFFGGELRTGLLVACIFPILLVVGAFLLKKRAKKHPRMNI